MPAEKVLSVPGFFTGKLVPPVARVVADRVFRSCDDPQCDQHWKKDGHTVSVHVHPCVLKILDVFAAENKALVLDAQDGNSYRLLS